MFSGAELAAALKSAMAAKRVTQDEVAREFGIRQPSVAEWCKFGRIAKKHIPHLVEYFSDQVGPTHWGLPESWGGVPVEAKPAEPWPFERLGPAEWRALDDRARRAAEEAAIQVIAALRARSPAEQRLLDRLAATAVRPAPGPASEPHFQPKASAPRLEAAEPTPQWSAGKAARPNKRAKREHKS